MKPEEELSIGELAEREGVTPRTIRYYVSEGLLPAPHGEGSQWLYGAEHGLRLRLIRRLQAEHLPLKEIRARLGSLSLREMEALLSQAPRHGRVAARRLLQAILNPASGPAVSTPSAPTLLREIVPEAPAPPAAQVWTRVTLVPGVELHYREGTHEGLVERIRLAAQTPPQEDVE